jgi:hypothetical protein
MENIQRYKGTVAAVHPNHAFIKLSSVTKLDGSEHDLTTTHDIFVHKASFDHRDFRVGMGLSFEVEDDVRSKKQGALRAEEVVYSGIELHFTELLVDHPTVPIAWCFKSDVLEYIKDCPRKTFGLVVGAVLSDPSSRVRVLEGEIGLEALKDGRSFVSFYTPGEYQVYAYLVEYDSDERTVKKAMKGVDVYSYDATNYGTERILTKGSNDLPFLHQKEVSGKVLALSTLSLSVPDGIFAKPMAGWKKKWFCYFWDEDLLDDCDRRGKMTLAFTVGFPAFTVWEFLKRFSFLVIGLVVVLIGANPKFAWSESFSSKLSANWYSVKYGILEDLMDYSGWKAIFRPWAVLSALCSLVWLWIYPIVLVYVGAVVAVAALALLLFIIWWLFIRKTEEEVMAKETLRNERVWEQFETSVQCSAVPVKKTVSVRLMWSGLKRQVCRTYKRS